MPCSTAPRSAAPGSPAIQDLDCRSHQRAPLRILDRGARGRGVVAEAPILRGSLVERSPVLIIPQHDRAAVDPTIIFTYVFMWEHGTTEEDLYGRAGRAGIALGYTSLLNHAPRPNCTFVRHIDQCLLDLVAARDIGAGEELTIDYQMTLWFAPDGA